jgi:RNA polymerase sigma factor (sigma-70 family)
MDNPTVGIIYKLADGKRIRIDVTIEVKELLEQSDRQIRSQRRKDRRYLDFVGGVNELEAIAPLHEDTADLVSRMDSNGWLYAALEKLPVFHKRRICLRHLSGLTCLEVARIERVHHSTVSRSLHKALKMLKEYLDE